MVSGGSGTACDPKIKGTGYYLAVGGAAATQNYAHIATQIRKHKWDVQLTDRTEDMALFSVQGPKSRDLLKTLTSADLSNEAFPFGTHQVVEVAGHRVRALRVSFVGELGEATEQCTQHDHEILRLACGLQYLTYAIFNFF